MGGAKNCPETPRQKMIGMMYLVLTAMLALNVSKDILDGFTRVDNSLHFSIEAAYNRNQKLYTQFKSMNEDNHEKTDELYSKAQDLRRKSDSLYNYIQDYKVGIVKLADGVSAVEKRTNLDENGDPTRNIDNKDNKDVTGEYTFRRFEEDGISNGEHLKMAIDRYRTFLCELVREHEPQLEGQFNTLFSTDEVFNNNDKKYEPWTIATFDEVPICASITLLSKIQNDIRSCEGQTLQYLMQRTDAADLRVNKFEAHVIPDPTDYVLKGGKYRAKLILAAVDSTKTPDFYVDGVKLGPDGIYEIAATTPGPKTVKGYVTFLDNEGAVKEYTFEHNYTVGEPSVSISNKDLNVIYAGYDNKYTVSVPGVSSDKLKVIVEGGKKTKDDNRGNIEVSPTVPVGQKVKIIVQANVAGDGKYVTMGSTEYEVKKMQRPDGCILYNGNPIRTKISATTLVSANTIVGTAYPPEVLIQVESDVISFQTKINGQVKDSNGNKFSKDQINQIKKLKAGSGIKLQSVKYRIRKTGEEGYVDEFWMEITG